MPVIAPHLRPGLTSMELPFVEMGRRGVARLLAGDIDPTVELLHCPLVARRSVGRIGSAS
jgi:LacI family transcriptional regulator